MRFSFTAAGDVASFDSTALRTTLLRMFPTADDVFVNVAPASVSAVVRLVMSSSRAASDAADYLRRTPMDMLSAELGVAIEGDADRSVAVVIEGTLPLPTLPAPTPVHPASPPTYPQMMSTHSEGLSPPSVLTDIAREIGVALGMSVVVLLLTGIGCAVCLRGRRLRAVAPMSVPPNESDAGGNEPLDNKARTDASIASAAPGEEVGGLAVEGSSSELASWRTPQIAPSTLQPPFDSPPRLPPPLPLRLPPLPVAPPASALLQYNARSGGLFKHADTNGNDSLSYLTRAEFNDFLAQAVPVLQHAASPQRTVLPPLSGVRPLPVDVRGWSQAAVNLHPATRGCGPVTAASSLRHTHASTKYRF